MQKYVWKDIVEEPEKRGRTCEIMWKNVTETVQ